MPHSAECLTDMPQCQCACVYGCVCPCATQVSEERATPGAYTVSVTLPKLQTCVTEFEADPDTDLFQVRATHLIPHCPTSSLTAPPHPSLPHPIPHCHTSSLTAPPHPSLPHRIPHCPTH